MRTIVNPDQHRHHGRGEFTDGRMMPCVEMPARAAAIEQAVREAALGPIEPPTDHGMAPILAAHAPAFVHFLEGAWPAWAAQGRDDDAFPTAWPTRPLRDVEPAHIAGRLGYWCFDSATPIGAGTWSAAYGSAQAALTAAAIVGGGEAAAFALCRPPGHHAAADAFGGYCYLNNAGIAAQSLIAAGASRVAVLDIDYHHGNGTQAMFYGRGDVLFVSLHADPAEEYPYFLGYADERGVGAGEGANVNLPLPAGTAIDRYHETLVHAAERVRAWRPDALVVSLGVDTYEGDPISRFRLRHQDFPLLGRTIAGIARPTLFVMEGGYAVDAIGGNTAGVLAGFLGR